MRECARGGFDRWAFLAGRQCQQLRGQGLDLTLDRGRVQRLVLAGQPVLHGLADGAGIGQDALEWCLRGVVGFGDLRPVTRLGYKFLLLTVRLTPKLDQALLALCVTRSRNTQRATRPSGSTPKDASVNKHV